MKVLFTSDTQADFDNLELCRKSVEEILQLKDQHGFQVVVHCGDLKHVYNPVDIRVITFWQQAIEKLRAAGLIVVVLLGNHDRVGMHVDKQNWLPVLRRAGATCFDDPDILELGKGAYLAALPFRRDSVLLRREATDLAKRAVAGKTVLIFHSDLQSTRYNVLSRSTAEMVAGDLRPERYVYCIGGHVHFQQRLLGNVYYVGSPYATDWGEANQVKGYLLFDYDAARLSRIRSRIPGWYDPVWPGFEEAKPKSWQGARVRIKVPCSEVQNVRQRLEEAGKTARKKYEGAFLTIVPEFVGTNREGLGRIKTSFPDEKKIQLYLQETLPAELKGYEGTVKRYLLSHLSKVGGLQREQGELKFRSWKAKNFLSYRDLDFRIENGLYVVAGQNKDWKNKSNGSGKTNFLQPIAVAHSGQTFKGQKHDGWMREGTNKGDESWVKLWFHDAQDRACQIWRGRNPKTLRLTVNKEIVDSGNRPEATQKVIEQVTGYTWDTLSNAIYVDQAASHLLLTGTDAQRKGFLAKLQNLERFERAHQSIKEEKLALEARYNELEYRLQSFVTEEKNLLRTITDTKAVLGVQSDMSAEVELASSSYLAKKEQYEEWQKEASKNRQKLEDIQQALVQKILDLESKRQVASFENKRLAQSIEKWERLEGECPTCGQDIADGHTKELTIAAKVKIEKNKKVISQLVVFIDELKRKRSDVENRSFKWFRNSDLANQVDDSRDEWQKLKQKKLANDQKIALLNKLKKRRQACVDKIQMVQAAMAKFGKRLLAVKYAMLVFQRDGLPSHLNAQLCPELNQAAQEYSELFAQGEIQVRFEVDAEGSMDVFVINVHGGEGIENQSKGEKRLASLITSFAVRSVAPKTNLLIVDEPGEGLDAISARSFAKGLSELQKRFCSILLTTHNEHILSALSGEKQVFILKEGKVSQVGKNG
jgi:DNA repair exonuclease SbcCD ATPase subunit/DNA repair exonuclease SbcCD nuclease subunit